MKHISQPSFILTVDGPEPEAGIKLAHYKVYIYPSHSNKLPQNRRKENNLFLILIVVTELQTIITLFLFYQFLGASDTKPGMHYCTFVMRYK